MLRPSLIRAIHWLRRLPSIMASLIAGSSLRVETPLKCSRYSREVISKSRWGGVVVAKEKVEISESVKSSFFIG